MAPRDTPAPRRQAGLTAPEAVGGDRTLGVIMAALLGIGFCLAAAALISSAGERRLARELSLDSLVSGRTAAAVNYVAAHHLPIGPTLQMLGGIWRWRIFGAGGPQVWVGRDDWLFLIDELRPWPHAEAEMSSRVDLARRVAARLRGQDIDLLVALVPDKARQAAALLDGPRTAQADRRYDVLVAALREAGLAVVDLRAALTDPDGASFYRADTHWNQAGAARAAAAIARAVTPPLARDRPARTVAAAELTEGPGDLLRLMSLDKVPDGLPIALRPPNDREHKATTQELDDGGAGLLDEPAAPQVALIGSSYSRHGNFAGALAEALATRVPNLAEAGGGFSGAIRRYLDSIALRETPPKLVIWEIPERVMPQPPTQNDLALRALLDAAPAQQQ
jgi:alginate O-acetyltransferase complex protein AlgJ